MQNLLMILSLSSTYNHANQKMKKVNFISVGFPGDVFLPKLNINIRQFMMLKLKFEPLVGVLWEVIILRRNCESLRMRKIFSLCLTV